MMTLCLRLTQCGAYAEIYIELHSEVEKFIEANMNLLG